MKSCTTVANEFIRLAGENSRPLTSMQVLKLVYIAHGWMLGLCDRPLIKETVQAWQHGPVIRELYNAIKHYKGSPVARIPTSAEEQLDEIETSIVGQVYRIYGHLTGPALSRLTHAVGTPWYYIYEPGSFGLVIPNDLIQDHYKELARS